MTATESPPTRRSGPNPTPGPDRSSVEATQPNDTSKVQPGADFLHLVAAARSYFDTGRAMGCEDCYRRGLAEGAEVGGARLLLDLEDVIGRERLDRLTRTAVDRLSYVGAWLDYRARTTDTDEPCTAQCGRCSRCIRAAVVERNRTRFGTADRPPAPALRQRRGAA